MPRHSKREPRSSDTPLAPEIVEALEECDQVVWDLRQARANLEDCERAVERATRALRRVGHPGAEEMGGGDDG